MTKSRVASFCYNKLRWRGWMRFILRHYLGTAQQWAWLVCGRYPVRVSIEQTTIIKSWLSLNLSFYTNSVITIFTLQVSSLRKLLVTHFISQIPSLYESRDRVISTVIRLRVGRFCFQIPGRKIIVPFPEASRMALGLTHLPVQWVPVFFLLPSFHGTRSLIAVCKTFHYWSLFCVIWV
jgi:hypothetical protein